MQEDGDSQQCLNTSDHKHSTRDKADRGKAIGSLSMNDEEKISLPKDRFYKLASSQERQQEWRGMNKEADCQIEKIESGLQSSQKENGPLFKRRSSARDLAARRLQDTENKDNNLEKSASTFQPDGILTELQINTARRKQHNLTSMMVNGVNHEAGKASQSDKFPLCFVITRLPKQFVVSTVQVKRCCRLKVAPENILYYLYMIQFG